MLGSNVRTLLVTHSHLVTSRGSYKALHSYPKPKYFQKLGPKHWDKTKLWIPTMVYYSLTLFLGTAYVCDWKYICQLIPFYSGKYSVHEPLKNIVTEDETEEDLTMNLEKEAVEQAGVLIEQTTKVEQVEEVSDEK